MRAPSNGLPRHLSPRVSDASVLVELAAQLRDEGVDLDSTILDRVARGDNARLILDETNAKLLGRLHTRSDDFAATKALQTVSTAAARLGVNNGHGPRAPARRRAERTDVVPPVQPSLGDELALRRVRAGLLLAIVVSLAWLVWRHPGPWQFGLAVAIGVALVLPTQVHPWVALGNVLHLDSLMGRIEALEPVRRWWQGVPVAGRATIPLLALFNTLIALLDAPALLSGVLVPSTILAFAAMCCVNLVVVNSWLRATPEPDLVPPPSYVVAPDAAGTIVLPAPSHDGHPNGNGNGNGNGAHAHPAENG
ncbi:MAG: hypothetical protein QOF40_1919, partial [Actinomycetota bacterium]|nr:hypothetical protein [Actinomycetota bacterium]